MSLWNHCVEAWRQRHVIGDKNNNRDLSAFLPAALEIQETPPNPLVSWLGRSLIILFVLAVVWACFGQVNIVATAEGKIIPSSKVKQIQPLEKAVVKNILVNEGDTVEQGQPLVELDATISQADEARLKGELLAAQMKKQVSETFLALLDKERNGTLTLENDIQLVAVSPMASQADITLNTHILKQQWRDYQAQKGAQQSAWNKAIAQEAEINANIHKLEQTIPIITKRVGNLEGLLKQEYVSENDFLDAERERIEQIQQLASEKERIKQAKASQREISQTLDALNAQTTSTQLANIAEQQRQITALNEEIIKAKDINAKRVLYAPVAGQVHNLAIHTVGGVVTEAQNLMTIVPSQEQLEVEVYLQNKDIGFVEEGMSAEVKIHTFPFTKYGVIDATVTQVSDDAITDEQQGLIFTMRAKMKQNSLWVNEKEIALIPGMAVTTEVNIGQRRIIEFILTPLIRARKEGLRER